MRLYTLLKGYADTYESAVKLRTETNNRMRCWLRDTMPQEEWGTTDFTDDSLNDKTVYASLPNDLRSFVDMITEFEKASQKYLHKEVKKHYMWEWLNGIRGIGPNLAAKLLAKIGDLDKFPTVSHLWSYCGFDGADWRKNKHNWVLTSIGWLIAGQFVKQGDVYRKIYDQRKVYEKTKPWCGKCRSKNEDTALPREYCTDGHIDNKARRYTVKQFLKDMWVENKKLQEKGA